MRQALRPRCGLPEIAMPLQNRVDPFGAIKAVPERGLLMGNRGIIHDPETKTLTRRWAIQAWIICVCQFRNVRRDPMGRNRPGGKAGWTELFFLDEVTALAAGHRPCFFCQRKRAEDFVGRFGKAFHLAEPRAPMLDKRLHKERLPSGGKAPMIPLADVSALPDGVVIAQGNQAFALRGGKALKWSFAGYGLPADLEDLGSEALTVLTPATTLAVLRHGFEPEWHPSAQA
jgi:hypothetical protein